MTATVPLASGREADVYAIDADRVLRRYREGGDVRVEAEVMTYLRGQGYPVPEVFRADGPELEMARLSGPTLTAAFVAGLVGLRSVARTLAELHRRLHALPTRHSADPAVGILHLDLHCDNVMLTADGPYVVDWRNTTEGPPELDRTTTALIIAETAVDPDLPLAGPAGQLLGAFLAESGPPLLLDEAVARRAASGMLDADLLARAAALVVSAGR
ncbi:phosphotransferase [Micromonospora psammae]|uniref:phosphotransferase n=1 Tax=Micromonospora sp. CPCC 205556 TaxID=3122398 RepID=UPI002FF1B4DD